MFPTYGLGPSFGTPPAYGYGPGLAPVQPQFDNRDPPITGGGRVMPEGAWPKWWEEWEEPQPQTESPTAGKTLAELIAEVAAGLDTPRTPIPDQDLPKIVQRFLAATQPEAQIRVKRKKARDKRRHLTALLLLRLLD